MSEIVSLGLTADIDPANPGATPGGNQELLARYQGALTNVFGTPQRVLVRGYGSRVWDADGKEYLDLLAGIAVNALGHAHPALSSIITSQLATLGHVSNLFTSPGQIALAEKLLTLANAPEGSTVFFTNSGTEANEAALKLARAFGNAEEPKRTKIVALSGGFHGRTLGALSVTAKEAFRAPFEPLPGPVVHIDPNDAAALDREVDDTCAALILEPIQGEAGVVKLDGAFLRLARSVTRDRGALLIVDEVQTGVGRTGNWFAYPERYMDGTEPPAVFASEDLPDVITLAKGLGGGFPIGAMICIGQAVSGILTPGSHGTTFGGNPVAAAAALGTLAIIEREGLLEHARDLGAHIARSLEELDGVREVRAFGLLIGISLEKLVAKELAAAALEEGFIINAPREDTLRLAPPLNLAARDAQTFIDAFDALLSDVSTTANPGENA